MCKEVRLNKEYKLDISDFVNVKYGSTNRINPVAIYIESNSWIIPKNNDTYKEDVDRCFSIFKKELKSKLSCSSVFDKKIILDYNVNTENIINKHKKNFLSFEIFVKQKDNNIYDLKDIKKHILDVFENSINSLISNLNKFEIELSKRR